VKKFDSALDIAAGQNLLLDSFNSYLSTQPLSDSCIIDKKVQLIFEHCYPHIQEHSIKHYYIKSTLLELLNGKRIPLNQILDSFMFQRDKGGVAMIDCIQLALDHRDDLSFDCFLNQFWCNCWLKDNWSKIFDDSHTKSDHQNVDLLKMTAPYKVLSWLSNISLTRQ
jgi:hypothetical protein